MEHETDERGDTGADKRQETKAAAGTGTTVVARTALGRALGEFVRAGVRFARTFARTHAAARARDVGRHVVRVVAYKRVSKIVCLLIHL
jgi:hypothetical protein|tara:strand:+ start:4115 stop:4381 length:267 start_codon:yes stop_codon:yes gene_type:complete